MKQNVYLLFLALFSLISEPVTSQPDLEVQVGNNFRWFQSTNGLNFFDQTIAFPGFEVPAFSGNHAIFASALWIGGIDEEDELKIAFRRFCQDSTENCLENWGPLKTDNTPSTLEEIEPYNDLWFITGSMIDLHRNYFDCLNDPLCDEEDAFPNYETPNEFLTWPAESEEGSGYAQNLAPFFDYNQDGSYDPNDGDHPVICGDFSSYTIWNGIGSENIEQQGHEFAVEVHTSIYGYNPEQESENYTLFVKHRIINRSSNTLSDTYAGFFTDFDLGNYQDDHIGTDVGRSMFYALNADDFDEGNSIVPGYGSNLPMMGVKVLAGPFKDDNGEDDSPLYESLYANETTGYGDGVIDNERLGLYSSMYMNNPEPPTGPIATHDPAVPIQYYNFMRGIWRDGLPLRFGGIGYNPSLGITAKYVYPGDSDPLFASTEGIDPNYPTEGGWTEANENNEGGDRRMIGSSGPFTFEPGDVQYIDLAYIFARESHDEDETVFETLQRYADEVEGMQCEPLPLIVLSDNSANEPKPLNIYPNPANDEIAFDLPIAQATMTIFDITGKEVRQAQLQGGNQRFDIEDLESGVYLIRIKSVGSVYHGKFVVEK